MDGGGYAPRIDVAIGIRVEFPCVSDGMPVVIASKSFGVGRGPAAQLVGSNGVEVESRCADAGSEN